MQQYSVSQKDFKFFPTTENFNYNFTCLLYVHVCANLQNCTQLS